MKRLTHEVDCGLEDWKEILYIVPADPEGAYNILDIAEQWARYHDADCGCILRDITERLRDYENIAPKIDKLYLEKCQEVSALQAKSLKEKQIRDEAMRKVMWEVGHTNNDVTRYISEAVANQVVRDERGGWIPAAERLPDKPGDYWVTMRHLDGSVTTVNMSLKI